MRATTITIQAIAFTALFAVYTCAHTNSPAGVRRALQTIGTTVETTTKDTIMVGQAV